MVDDVFFLLVCLFIRILYTYFIILFQFSRIVNVVSTKKTPLTSPPFYTFPRAPTPILCQKKVTGFMPMSHRRSSPRSIVIKASPLRMLPSPPSKLLMLYLEKTQITTLPPLRGISLKAENDLSKHLRFATNLFFFGGGGRVKKCYLNTLWRQSFRNQQSYNIKTLK